jgi:hypothetical protein
MTYLKEVGKSRIAEQQSPTAEIKEENFNVDDVCPEPS